jgi:hypothetical protein
MGVLVVARTYDTSFASDADGGWPVPAIIAAPINIRIKSVQRACPTINLHNYETLKTELFLG